MSLKFGTSGLRGLSVDLKGKASAVYATAFARHLLTSGQAKAGDPILVARDFRDSSPDVSATCIAALKKPASHRSIAAPCRHRHWRFTDFPSRPAR